MNVTNCVLVTLNISNWDANRQDRRVSALVADANDVKDQRLCRLRKSLLPKTQVMDRLYASSALRARSTTRTRTPGCMTALASWPPATLTRT